MRISDWRSDVGSSDLDTVNGGGAIVTQPSSVLALQRALGGVVLQDPYDRQVSVTPDLGYRSDVRDWGVSGELNWDFGWAELTSITAWRDWESKRGQDPEDRKSTRMNSSH